MTNGPDEERASPAGELRGWSFARAIALTVVLGGAYVVWKYFKHTVLFPRLGTGMWMFYAIAVTALLGWGIGTRFGTRKR
jgi:hypothetical protein